MKYGNFIINWSNLIFVNWKFFSLNILKTRNIFKGSWNSPILSEGNPNGKVINWKNNSKKLDVIITLMKLKLFVSESLGKLIIKRKKTNIFLAR